MPFAWLCAVGITITNQAKAAPATQLPDQVDVVGKVQIIDLQKMVWTYTDGVVATFGPTIVTADRRELHRSETEQYGIARGNVRIEDPEGEITANYVVFWFGKHRGPEGQIASADRVEFELAGVHTKAESAIIKEGRWEFLNVEGTNCTRPLPLYLLKSPKVVILPGKKGTLYAPKIEILGKSLGRFPNRTFSLDRRAPGFQFPSVGIKKGAGLGINWQNAFLLTDQSTLQFDFGAFPKNRPNYGVTYSQSFVPADKSDAKLAARSELQERFTWSYFDNIRVPSPASTFKATTKSRNGITAQSIWNTGSSSRLDNEQFSKAIDVAYERSDPLMGGGYYFSLRGQSIRRESEPFLERGLANATFQLPNLTLAPSLFTDFRIDAFGKAGGSGLFGWVRGQAGIVYEPIPQLRLGAAYVASAEGGKADYLVDRLYSRNAAHIRADLNLGPTKLSFLAKYDFDRHGWYDKEWTVSQVIGCLEPFLTRREFPKDYAVGVRLRLGDFVGLMERRNTVRTKPTAPQTISKLPPPNSAP